MKKKKKKKKKIKIRGLAVFTGLGGGVGGVGGHVQIGTFFVS